MPINPWIFTIISISSFCISKAVYSRSWTHPPREFYKIIGCRCVDCRSFEYNDTEYDVSLDDEFLLKNGPLYPTLFPGELKPNFSDVICGNFIIAKCNEDGETIGVS